MKNILTLLSLSTFLFCTTNYAQNDMDALKDEMSKVKSNIKSLETKLSTNTQRLEEQLTHIQKQDKKIESYERALKLLEEKHTAKLEEVTFNITKVIGNRTEGTLTFNGVLVNEGDKSLRIMTTINSEYYDNEANRVSILEVFFGSKRDIEIIPGIPTKFKAVAYKIPTEEVAKVTALSLGFRYGFSSSTKLIFKNMDIEWED